jgi:hypothetical protein
MFLTEIAVPEVKCDIERCHDGGTNIALTRLMSKSVVKMF